MPQVNTVAVQAASILAKRRLSGERGSRLPESLRPLDVDAALAIQACVTEQLCERAGGWKCGLSAENPVVMAPIHAGTVHTGSPCPVWGEAGQVRVEPELAFLLGHDLPARDTPYTAADVDAAIARTHLALELIGSRYADPASASMAEHLADGLLNQGLLIGPEINPSSSALDRMAIRIHRQDGRETTLEGKHPNTDPRAPLYWLAEFLRSRGQGLQAGQAVITGSYAGSFELPLEQETTIQFGDLGRLAVRFTQK
ncbi:MAG TPA: fumarylacetoacetate hydrolase family protein [Noviherbaspirillum sp.]|nr:fumarylacetoacetate hydrolase family protein [Noviherbaspirillum sp.]